MPVDGQPHREKNAYMCLPGENRVVLRPAKSPHGTKQGRRSGPNSRTQTSQGPLHSRCSDQGGGRRAALPLQGRPEHTQGRPDFGGVSSPHCLDGCRTIPASGGLGRQEVPRPLTVDRTPPPVAPRCAEEHGVSAVDRTVDRTPPPVTPRCAEEHGVSAGCRDSRRLITVRVAQCSARAAAPRSGLGPGGRGGRARRRGGAEGVEEQVVQLVVDVGAGVNAVGEGVLRRQLPPSPHPPPPPAHTHTNRVTGSPSALRRARRTVPYIRPRHTYVP